MKFYSFKLQISCVFASLMLFVGLLLGSCIIVEPVPVRRPVVIKVEERHDHDHKHGHKHGHEKHEKKKEHKEEEEEDDSIRIN